MEFPNLGEHCSNAACNRLDFLPLKCDACAEIFCNDHISYNNHACPSAYKKDVQVPVCPLCGAPVPSKRGEAPDIAVGLHMDSECKSEKRKIYSNRCSYKGCKIKEMIPVHCSECTLNFCLKHRHTTDHKCAGKNAVRLKNLKHLSESCKRSSERDSDVIKSIQGGMSEDEALARALQASMLEDRRQAVSSGYRDRCRLS